jgi:hypothetical protein
MNQSINLSINNMLKRVHTKSRSYRYLVYRWPVRGGAASSHPASLARPWVRQKEFGGDHYGGGRGTDQEAAV